jgi:hypothetical protein
MSRYGEEVVNENGGSFLELCRGGNMSIVQRIVIHQDREAIFDYFCVFKKSKKFVVNVK